MKTCSKCKIEQLESCFSKNRASPDGLCKRCKACAAAYAKSWAQTDSGKAKKRQSWARFSKSPHRKAYMVEYNQRESSKQAKKVAYDVYRRTPERREYNRLRQNRLRHGDIKVRLLHRMGCAIRGSLKTGKNGRHWESLVGYSVSDLIVHLESLFLEDMAWDNYGQWHIDHIKPISKFGLDSPDDNKFEECWALDNLQPLWAKDNLAKGNREVYH